MRRKALAACPAYALFIADRHASNQQSADLLEHPLELHVCGGVAACARRPCNLLQPQLDLRCVVDASADPAQATLYDLVSCAEFVGRNDGLGAHYRTVYAAHGASLFMKLFIAPHTDR